MRRFSFVRGDPEQKRSTAFRAPSYLEGDGGVRVRRLFYSYARISVSHVSSSIFLPMTTNFPGISLFSGVSVNSPST